MDKVNVINQLRERKECILFGACLFLAGIIVGFFIAPIKKGIYCGNYNGSYNQPTDELTAKKY